HCYLSSFPTRRSSDLRGILIIIESGGIIDTIILGLVAMIEGLPSGISVIGVFLAQTIFNFVVPSGSGKVLITMPILSPVADIVGDRKSTRLNSSHVSI